MPGCSSTWSRALGLGPRGCRFESCHPDVKLRDVAQPGSALAWGARGREFESRHPDSQQSREQSRAVSGCSSTWSERTLREREVAGSNPATPTNFRSSSNGKARARLARDWGSSPCERTPRFHPGSGPTAGRAPSASNRGSNPRSRVQFRGVTGVVVCTLRCERGGTGSIPV